MLWGFEVMVGGFAKLARSFKSGMTYIMVDWSKFDKTVPFWVIDDVFTMWRKHIDFSGYIPTKEYPNSSPSGSGPTRLGRLWRWLTHYCKHHPVRLPDGSLFTRDSNGVASGLMMTQVLDSFVNAIMLITCLIEMGIKFDFTREDFIKILGDDSLFGLLEEIKHLDPFLRALARHAKAKFGMEMNMKPGKSGITRNVNEISLLGYDYHNGEPRRDIPKLMAQFVNPERWTSPSQLKARALGFAYAACGLSRPFHNACKLLYLRFKSEELDVSKNDTLKQLNAFVGPIPDKFPKIDFLRSRLVAEHDSFEADEIFWNRDFFLSEC